MRLTAECSEVDVGYTCPYLLGKPHSPVNIARMNGCSKPIFGVIGEAKRIRQIPDGMQSYDRTKYFPATQFRRFR